MPTTPLDCYSLTYKFDLNQVGSNQDIAEFYLWMDGDGAEFGDAELAHLAAGGLAAWINQMPENYFASNVVLNSCIATSYLANGHILAQQSNNETTGWHGTASGAALPWETALACSLYTYPRGTFVPNGKRKRGRFYLPPMAADQLDASNSGFLADAAVASLLGHLHDFVLAAQESDAGVPVGHLSVFSRMDSELRHVTQISLDAKFDSQRRRQNRELAGYQVTDFP